MYGGLKASIHQATLLLATVVTRLYQPCSRVVASLLQSGYNCCKQQYFCCWQQAIFNIHLATMLPATLLLCCWQQRCLVDNGLKSISCSIAVKHNKKSGFSALTVKYTPCRRNSSMEPSCHKEDIGTIMIEAFGGLQPLGLLS